MEGKFTLDDFLEQMAQVKKMGPLNNIVGMLPGVPKEVRDVEIDDRELARVEGIIHSMTVAERADPAMIDGSRRRRIADGSGVSPSQVSQLIKQFRQMQKMMKGMPGMAGGSGGGRKKGRRKKGGGRVTAPKAAGKPPLELPGLN